MNYINEYINGIDLAMSYDAGSIVSSPNSRWQVKVENI
jgi:hypothetical protein